MGKLFKGVYSLIENRLILFKPHHKQSSPDSIEIQDLDDPKLKDWIVRYQKTYGNRRHHLTFEYVMLRDINDTDHHAVELAELVTDLGQLKVNLIPYNFTDLGLSRSTDQQIYRFKRILEDAGVEVMVRKTMGDDIAAACGQLIVLGAKKTI